MSSSQSPIEFGAVIVGGGSGQRFGRPDKILTPLAGEPLLWHSVNLFARHPGCVEIIIVLGRLTMKSGQDIACGLNHPNIAVVPGGETRRESVLSGLAAISDSCEYIAVHDAARPLLDSRLVVSLLVAAHASGAAVPVAPVTDTIHVIDRNNFVANTPDRDFLRAAQTPQIARRTWLLAALNRNDDATDEAASLAKAGYPVATVAGDPDNIKVTWPEDIERAESILSRRLLSR